MSSKAAKEIVSDFITASELAQRLGYYSTNELWKHVRKGILPLPHSQRGERVYLWRRDWYEHFKQTGRWPENIRFQSTL